MTEPLPAPAPTPPAAGDSPAPFGQLSARLEQHRRHSLGPQAQRQHRHQELL